MPKHYIHNIKKIFTACLWWEIQLPVIFSILILTHINMDNPKNTDTDVLITKEVFHVKYVPPQYIDLTTDDNETDVTHISETQIPPKDNITVISSDEEDTDTLSLKSNTSAENW